MQAVKFTRRGNSYTLAVPRSLIAQLQWAPGDLVALYVDGKELRAQSMTPHLLRIENRRKARAQTKASAGSPAAADGSAAREVPGAQRSGA